MTQQISVQPQPFTYSELKNFYTKQSKKSLKHPQNKIKQKQHQTTIAK